MKRADRVTKIAQYLSVHHSSTVSELGLQFDVSTMTIRRDLTVLEDRGIVRVFHGGVVFNGAPEGSLQTQPIQYTLLAAGSQHVEQKRRVGKRAASLIAPHDTIIIDTGSTTECVARAIPPSLPVTILCYNLNILLQVSKLKDAELVFAGGYYHPETMLFESAEGLELIRRNRANKAFVAAAGIDLEMGVTSLTHEGRTKRAIMETAKTKILVVDSSKFGGVFQAYFADLSDFDIVVTDSGIPEEYAAEIRRLEIELIIA